MLKKSIVSVHIFIVFMLPFVVCARAQSLDQETCDGPVYLASQLSRRATITSRPDPAMTQEALSHDVHGRVVIEAVLCHTGKVTDVRVIESLPDGMTEKAVEAARSTKFTPAEINGQPVSQKMRFEFSFNERGLEEIAAKEAEGRLVDFLEIIGNRRVTDKEIRECIQTQPGQPFREEQIKKDLAAILATGQFDKRLRVAVEESGRGGVGVVFEVQELPLISDLKFEGLEGISEAVILEELQRNGIDLQRGRVYDPVKVRAARMVIRKLLELNGRSNAEVQVRTDEGTSTTLNLTFIVVTRGE